MHHALNRLPARLSTQTRAKKGMGTGAEKRPSRSHRRIFVGILPGNLTASPPASLRPQPARSPPAMEGSPAAHPSAPPNLTADPQELSNGPHNPGPSEGSGRKRGLIFFWLIIRNPRLIVVRYKPKGHQ